MKNKDFIKKFVTHITKLMCKINDVDYESVNWKDGSHLKIPWKDEQKYNDFINELSKYIRSLSRKEMKEVYGVLVHDHKTMKWSKYYAKAFENNYGFSFKGIYY